MADGRGVSGVREILADVLGNPAALDLPPETPLFGPPLGMTSLTGVELLARIQDRFGVDIARDDLDLKSLESVGALCDYVASARPRA
jgi:acyl carrier protein